MHRIAAALALTVLASPAGAFQFPASPANTSRGDFCPAVLASTKDMRTAQAPCRQTGGTRAAPICGGSCLYDQCIVLRDPQGRPYCGCG
jgi:hypothetical protein